VAEAGYFDPVAVERLVAKARKAPSLGTRDDQAFLGVLSTQLWHAEFIEHPASNLQGRAVKSDKERDPTYAVN